MQETLHINMTNDSNIVIQPDDWKINMNDAWQVLWWCRYLGLTKSQLEAAIVASGNGIVDVKRYLACQQVLMTDAPRQNAATAEPGALQAA